MVIKGSHHSKETRNKISKILKGKPSSCGMLGKHLSVEHKKKLSEAMKGRQFSEESKRRMSESGKGKTISEEHKRKISKIHKGVKHKPISEETRRKMSEARKGKPGLSGNKSHSWKGGEIKINCKICDKERYVTPANIKRGKGRFCSHRCSGVWIVKNMNKKNITDIERLIENELIRRKIPYTKQVPLLGITLVDFLLPHDIVIYCDGEYWHSFKKVKERDINQDFILSFYGYKVFRFKGKDIKKSAKKCVEKIYEK